MYGKKTPIPVNQFSDFETQRKIAAVILIAQCFKNSTNKKTLKRGLAFFLIVVFIGDPERISFVYPQKLRFENQQKKTSATPKIKKQALLF